MLCRDIGPLDATIMIVDDAPNQQSELEGIPLSGSDGKLLKAMLASSGINYNKCFITCVSPERPPGDNFGYFYEDQSRHVPKESLQKRWNELTEKIKRINPKAIICLGEESLRAVTNKRGIGSWRGTRIEVFNASVIPVFHPASILRASTKVENEKASEAWHRYVTEMDLLKAKRESEGIDHVKPVITINPTSTEVIEWLDDIQDRVAFDIETVGNRIRCIGFAKRKADRTHAICIPFMRFVNSTSPNFNVGQSGQLTCSDNDVNFWPAHVEELILERVAKVLEDAKIEKVGQNSIHFDQPFIYDEFKIKINNHYMDIMHAWHLLYPTFPKGLDFICSVLTDYPNYWSDKDTQVDVMEWEYNAMDCIVTLEASYKIEQEINDFGLRKLYFNHVHPLVNALLKAEQRGVLFDVEEAKKMKERLQKNLEMIQKDINTSIGREINILSPKQLQELLYDILKFPTVYHRKTKKPTTDEDALRRLQKKYPSEPTLSRIIAYRKTSKLISTYVEPKLDPDGRIRCSYNASGTITGRISSTKTMRGTGMDLHNIPKGYTRGSESTRHLYKADAGDEFVVGDLKQAEAMFVAWVLLSLGDSTLYDLYQDPTFDIHKWCAAHFVYQIPEEEVTKQQRQQGGKLANHSGNYKAGPGVMERRAIQEGYEGFTFQFCKAILERRTNGIPGLRRWWEDVERKVKATRTLTTCYNRHLHFLGRLDDSEIRSAIAFEPQSTVADVCNELFIKLDNKTSYYPVMTTHDEIVLVTKKGNGGLVAHEMSAISRIPLQIRPNIPPLIIPIEIGIGKNWRDLEEWHP